MKIPCYQHDGYRADCADCRDMSGELDEIRHAGDDRAVEQSARLAALFEGRPVPAIGGDE